MFCFPLCEFLILTNIDPRWVEGSAPKEQQSARIKTCAAAVTSSLTAFFKILLII